MKKKDYMKLSKERLAELLEERDMQNNTQPIYVPVINRTPMCYENDGVCTNPQKDCINCPKLYDGGTYTTFTTNSHLNDNLNEGVQ